MPDTPTPLYPTTPMPATPVQAALTAQQDSSKAWLQQNRPDLVNAPSNSAAQAAQINSDYLNNRLPVLPTNGDPVGTFGYNQQFDYSGMSQANRAAAYMAGNGNPLILTWQGGDANHRGTAIYLTSDEYKSQFGMTDDQEENAKHNAAFSQPRNDLGALSPAAQAITDQYNSMRGRTVTGGGVIVGSNQGTSVAENPFNPDSAAGGEL